MPDLYMAYKKTCDECGKELGTDGTPFLQIHGSISEQVEDTNGQVMYKYLTPHAHAKTAFCNNACFDTWCDGKRTQKEYVERPVYPQG